MASETKHIYSQTYKFILWTYTQVSKDIAFLNVSSRCDTWCVYKAIYYSLWCQILKAETRTQRLRHRDSPLLLSLGAEGRWTWEHLGKELAWENSQQQCQRFRTLHTSPLHATTTQRWEPDPVPNPALSMVLQERLCPIREGTALLPPLLLPPVARTESVSGTITNAQ